ncbi:MAG: hypothetical protein K0R51_3471 [Cytophagaceae bacterium]|jgi:hypothetical protein|nr:hypothetical protein [Cytophagaceae bacterium]
MNDKEKEELFKSINNFDDFIRKLEFRQDQNLNNKIKINFDANKNNIIEVDINNKKHLISNSDFLHFIKELKTEKLNQDNQELSIQNKLSEERKRNDIFKIGDNSYKVHKEYIENMYFASDIASAHGAYLSKLRELIRIFNNNSILTIERKEIKTKEELLSYLKLYGFQSIENDMH